MTERRPQMHISGLDRLWTCGEAFRRTYISLERLPRGTYMAVGSGVDNAVNWNLQSKIDTGKLLSVEEVKAIARDSAEAEWEIGEIAYSKDELQIGKEKAKANAIDKAVRLAGLHAEKIAPKLEPIAVQRKWSIEIPGIPFNVVGTLDVQEKNRIRDTKTSKKSPAAGIADMSDQLTTYALAVKTLDGVLPDEVALDYLIDTQKPVAKTYTSTRNVDDFQVLLNRIENAADVIQKGAFTPAKPTDWVCSQTWCGFFDSCRFAKKPKSVAIPATNLELETA